MRSLWIVVVMGVMGASLSAEEPPEDVLEEEILEDESSTRIETVALTPERLAKIGGAAHIVSEEDLKHLDTISADAAMSRVPGVFVRGEDGFGLRPNIGIRGASSDRSKKVVLMEDGVLIAPAAYSAPAAYVFPQIGRMSGVEVYKGPGGIQFGPNTNGGAINFVSRRIPKEFSGGLELQGGQYFTGRSHGWVGSSTEWGGFVAEGFHLQSNGFKELDGGGDTGFDRQEFVLKGSLNTDYSAQHFHRLDTKLVWSRERSNETYLGLSPADFAATPDRRYRASALDQMNWVRAHVEARHTYEFGDMLQVSTVLYRSDLRRSWDKFDKFVSGPSTASILRDPTGDQRAFYDVLTGTDSQDGQEFLLGNGDRTYTSQGVQSSFRWMSDGVGWGNMVELGARVHYDDERRRDTQLAYRMQNGELQPAGETESKAIRSGETIAFSAHLLDQFSWWRFTLTPGVRMERYFQTSENQVTGEVAENDHLVWIPGAGLSLETLPQLYVFGGAHRGFSPTSPGQDPEIKPEMSTNYEAGVRYVQPKTKRLVEVVGFLNDYSNLLGECGVSAGCDIEDRQKQFNAGEAEVYGVEVAAQWAFELSDSLRFPAKVSYTWTQTEFKSAFTSPNPQYGDVEPGDQMPYVPSHQAFTEVGVQWNEVQAYVGATYVGAMREEAGVGEAPMTDEALLFDANVVYEFLPGWRASLKAENFTNNRGLAATRPAGARPVRPLLIMGGLGYSF